jgi:hypothetical protein
MGKKSFEGRNRIFRLSVEDNNLLTEIKDRLSLSNDSEAIRVTIRKFAKGEVLQ